MAGKGNTRGKGRKRGAPNKAVCKKKKSRKTVQVEEGLSPKDKMVREMTESG